MINQPIKRRKKKRKKKKKRKRKKKNLENQKLNLIRLMMKIRLMNIKK